jgi:ferric-dicitrate binding protein FerR (iron transport regulator)
MEELLNRYFAGTLTDFEKATLFKQIAQDDALKAEYVRLQNLVAVSGMISREGDERWTAECFQEVIHRINVRKFSRAFLFVAKYAAAILLLVGTWFFSKEYASKENVSGAIRIEAPKGQRVHVTLADGTEAWLSSRTRLKVSSRFNQKDRVVELDGEGFFSVCENKQIPFIVQTKQYNVQVTGTQFNVFAYSESALFETDLIEGAVFVFNKDEENKQLHLLPNEKACDRSGQLLKAPSTFLHSHYTKNGIYGFENQSLKDIVKRMELWYDVKIHITKPEMANYSFSGKFRQTDDIGHILQAVKATGKFNYRIVDEKRIEIY